MMIRISHPDLAPDLVDALNGTDCLATRIAPDTVEVLVPWLADDVDSGYARPSCASSSGVMGQRPTRSCGRPCSRRF